MLKYFSPPAKGSTYVLVIDQKADPGLDVSATAYNILFGSQLGKASRRTGGVLMSPQAQAGRLSLRKSTRSQIFSSRKPRVVQLAHKLSQWTSLSAQLSGMASAPMLSSAIGVNRRISLQCFGISSPTHSGHSSAGMTYSKIIYTNQCSRTVCQCGSRLLAG